MLLRWATFVVEYLFVFDDDFVCEKYILGTLDVLVLYVALFPFKSPRRRLSVKNNLDSPK